MAGRDLVRSQAQLPLKVLTNVECRPDAQGYVQLHLENLQGFSGLFQGPSGSMHQCLIILVVAFFSHPVETSGSIHSHCLLSSSEELVSVYWITSS